MNALAEVLTRLAEEEQATEAAYKAAMAPIVLAAAEVEGKYGERLRTIQTMKKAVQESLEADAAAHDALWWQIHNRVVHDTDPETTKKMRRAMRRERRANAQDR